MRLDKLLNSRNKPNNDIHQTPTFLKGAKVENTGRGKITGIRFIIPDEPVNQKSRNKAMVLHAGF